MITPRVVPVVSITGLLGLLLSGTLAYAWVESNAHEERQDCERSVGFRNDQRAMWLYLLDETAQERTPEQQERVAAFKVELNDRLPSLKCEDGNLVKP